MKNIKENTKKIKQFVCKVDQLLGFYVAAIFVSLLNKLQNRYL